MEFLSLCLMQKMFFVTSLDVGLVVVIKTQTDITGVIFERY